MEKNNEMVSVYVKQITVIMIAFCIKLMLEIHLVIFAFTPRLHKYKKLKCQRLLGKGDITTSFCMEQKRRDMLIPIATPVIIHQILQTAKELSRPFLLML